MHKKKKIVSSPSLYEMLAVKGKRVQLGPFEISLSSSFCPLLNGGHLIFLEK